MNPFANLKPSLNPQANKSSTNDNNNINNNPSNNINAYIAPNNEESPLQLNSLNPTLYRAGMVTRPAAQEETLINSW
jgi:hypothetical protein